jgi:hypothetical protein
VPYANDDFGNDDVGNEDGRWHCWQMRKPKLPQRRRTLALSNSRQVMMMRNAKQPSKREALSLVPNNEQRPRIAK